VTVRETHAELAIDRQGVAVQGFAAMVGLGAATSERGTSRQERNRKGKFEKAEVIQIRPRPSSRCAHVRIMRWAPKPFHRSVRPDL